MARRTLFAICILFVACALLPRVSAQGREPYPKAVTDRLIHEKTSMAPPPRNVVFVDPDFGSSMVRVTDRSTNSRFPGTFLRTEASGSENEWSSDTRKFYVVGKGSQVLVFGFDPQTMKVSSLPNASQGKGLLLPMRPGSFSFVDPDLIYGTTNQDPLTINSYRFSTGAVTPVIDTRTCGVQPPLGSGPSVRSDDDVSSSGDDRRVAISEGAPDSGDDMYIVVYDKKLGCRWYNTQTGQIGGYWGVTGQASLTKPYLIRHAYLSKSGKYVVILVNYSDRYVWDLSTLTVRSCMIGSGMECGGYGVRGYNTYINGSAVLDDMQVVKRPMNNLSLLTQLVYPLPSPGNWGQAQHFSWSNADAKDSTPVCGSTYGYDGDTDQPFGGEIFCVETDGLASTVWRFAHNRATYIEPFFQTQPLGNVSLDGRFYIFTSNWDTKLGTEVDGTPRSDVFIVKLD